VCVCVAVCVGGCVGVCVLMGAACATGEFSCLPF